MFSWAVLVCIHLMEQIRDVNYLLRSWHASSQRILRNLRKKVRQATCHPHGKSSNENRNNLCWKGSRFIFSYLGKIFPGTGFMVIM